MQITMGLDTIEKMKSIADLVADFRFESTEVELVHVLDGMSNDSLPPRESMRQDLIAQFIKMREDEAKSLLDAGLAQLKQREIKCRSQLLKGFSGNRIVAHAEESKSQLLALGSSEKGPLESALLGSVGRKALTSAKCSVLIAKNYQKKAQGLTIVLATDHSPYAKQCLETFLSWRPQGIERVVVLTVYPEHVASAMSAAMSAIKADIGSWVREEFQRENANTVSKLSVLGVQCRSRVETGTVGATLERVMKEEKADVLVLGAQGHGFMDRLLIGSVSLDQATRRPYSVLVIRS